MSVVANPQRSSMFCSVLVFGISAVIENISNNKQTRSNQYTHWDSGCQTFSDEGAPPFAGKNIFALSDHTPYPKKVVDRGPLAVALRSPLGVPHW